MTGSAHSLVVQRMLLSRSSRIVCRPSKDALFERAHTMCHIASLYFQPHNTEYQGFLWSTHPTP